MFNELRCSNISKSFERGTSPSNHHLTWQNYPRDHHGSNDMRLEEVFGQRSGEFQSKTGFLAWLACGMMDDNHSEWHCDQKQGHHALRAGALRPIKSPKDTSTPWPQSFQGRHINIPKGTSIQRNPHGHGPMCWCRVNSYNTLKSILSYGKYATKPT